MGNFQELFAGFACEEKGRNNHLFWLQFQENQAAVAHHLIQCFQHKSVFQYADLYISVMCSILNLMQCHMCAQKEQSQNP